MLGNIDVHPPTIVEIPPDANNNNPHQVAYAAYINNGKTLVRIMVLNMLTFNSTANGAGLLPLADNELPTRTSTKSQFNLPDKYNNLTNKTITLRRLRANGSDAITGITWDGWSYDYESRGGKPVRMENVTVGETVEVEGGVVSVDVEDSGAVLLDFEGGGHEGKENGAGGSSGARGWIGVVVFWMLLFLF